MQDKLNFYCIWYDDDMSLSLNGEVSIHIADPNLMWTEAQCSCCMQCKLKFGLCGFDCPTYEIILQKNIIKKKMEQENLR